RPGMASPEFPRRLEYLRAAIDQLAGLAPGALNEGTDTSLLESAVRERIKEFSSAEATKTLRADFKALGDWLRQQPSAEPAANFVMAWLIGAAPSLVGQAHPSAAIREMLSGLPPAPPPRDFDPLPQFPRVRGPLAGDGNVFLYLLNGASRP